MYIPLLRIVVIINVHVLLSFCIECPYILCNTVLSCPITVISVINVTMMSFVIIV